MDFKANNTIWGTMFGIPCIIADNFLKLASGEQIKVLLYLLRHSGRNITSEEIASNTGVSPQQTENAIIFWQQVNVLSSDSSLNKINAASNITNPPVQNVRTDETDSEKTSDHLSVLSQIKRPDLKNTEIVERMQQSQDIADLFKVAESILGTLNNAMYSSIIWYYDYLGLKKEVIITLIHYCKSIEKTYPKYIDAIAVDWADGDINTLKKSQEEVNRLSALNEYKSRIMWLFKIKDIAKKNLKLIESWQKMGIPFELVNYAYEKTLENINKISFPYINKILVSWYDSGFKTVEEVKYKEPDFMKNKSNQRNNEEKSDIDKYKFVINNI